MWRAVQSEVKMVMKKKKKKKKKKKVRSPMLIKGH
jgi:hypothetical protein